jgi:DNA (cytosine-5)-methyltransferase 1
MLQTVDLFSGIGGFSRGLEATGFFKTTRFVENDPYCQAVLRHHWPDIPVLGDIKNARRPDFPERTDLVCGGFPCQPFSQAGKQQAQDDPRHLWPEMFRIIRELRPTWVCGENVTGLIRLGLDEVLTDLEGEGYATRTFNIPACATGAPHLRQRLWIIAHANSESEPDGAFDGGAGSRQLGFEFVADPKSVHGEGPDQKRNSRGKPEKKAGDRSSLMADPDSTGLKQDHWSFEPEVGRLVDGLPNRVPQLRALGNSIIPQIAERIGYAIASTLKGE